MFTIGAKRKDLQKLNELEPKNLAQHVSSQRDVFYLQKKRTYKNFFVLAIFEDYIHDSNKKMSVRSHR